MSPVGIDSHTSRRNGSCRRSLKCFRQKGHLLHSGWDRRCARNARHSSCVHPRNCHGGTRRAARITAYSTLLATCTRGAMHKSIDMRIVGSAWVEMYGAWCFLFPSFPQSFILPLLPSLSSSFSLVVFCHFCASAKFKKTYPTDDHFHLLHTYPKVNQVAIS